MRRLKTDRSIISDLPEKIINDEYCHLTKRQAGLYGEILNSTMRLIENSDGNDRQGLIFKLMTSLKQICNHPGQLTGRDEIDIADSGKLLHAIEIIERVLLANEKIIIFTQYRKMADILDKSISRQLGIRPLVFSGSVSRKNREKFVQKFQSDPFTKVMVITLHSGGVGLNLTAATHVMHYDLWWNPAVENQATDRAFRIGQKKNVQVHRLISAGTFEEKINAMIQSKTELANLAVNAGEKWITELGNDELKGIFELKNK
jgi:SNF2 family DNA or RNA helicase